MTHLPFDRVWSPHRFAIRLMAPLRWRKPAVARIGFDLFADGVEDEFRLAVFGVMAAAPRHTFQLLTKRPERMSRFFQQGDPVSAMKAWARRAGVDVPRPAHERDDWHTGPLPNVWLGTSVEDQRAADERVPHLLGTPAAVRFLSCEPLLGPVDLRSISTPAGWVVNALDANDALVPVGGPRVSWVIVGGESGPSARPCDVAWIRSIVQQCAAAGVACWVKQLGARPVARDRWDMTEEQFENLDASEDGWSEADGPVVLRLRDRKGTDWSEFPEDLRVWQMPEVTR